MIFATTLLQKAKTLLNSKENRHSSSTSSLNMMHANDNNKPSCSNINTVFNNITENNTSDTENISDTSDTEVITEKWGHKAILLLTSLYKKKSCIIEKGSHKKMWIEISRCMKQKKHNFTSSQCNNKMDALKRRYRLIVDHNAQSGNDKREWIYFDVLDDIFRNKHWITLVSIAGSNIKESEHSPLTDSNDENKPAIIHMGEFLSSIGEELSTFVGIKFTSANLEEGLQALYADNKKYIIFLGNDQIVNAACAAGMDSFIITSVNIFPELVQDLISAGKDGNILKARKLQEKLSSAINAITKQSTWVQTMKTAMTLLTNINVGPPRVPLKPVSSEAIATMKQDLTNLGY